MKTGMNSVVCEQFHRYFSDSLQLKEHDARDGPQLNACHNCQVSYRPAVSGLYRSRISVVLGSQSPEVRDMFACMNFVLFFFFFKSHLIS